MNKLEQNELQFKRVNEQMSRTVARLAPTDSPEDMILNLYCECANKLCLEDVRIGYQEYLEISKRQPRLFVVLPDHYLPEYEHLVEAKKHYWAIIKRPDKLDKPFEV